MNVRLTVSEDSITPPAPPSCLHPTTDKERAEAEARRDTVTAALGDKERRLGEARRELDRAQKEARHVDSQRNRLAVQLEEVEGQLREARQVRKVS